VKKIHLFASVSPFSLIAGTNLDEWLRVQETNKELQLREEHMRIINANSAQARNAKA
jgi:hypothetical protein